MSNTEGTNNAKEIRVLHISSWFPKESNPYLGNFCSQFILSLPKHISSEVLLRYPALEGTTLSTKNPKACSFLSWFRFLVKEIRKSNADILHLHVSIELWFLGWILPFLWKKPVILTEHGSYMRPDQFSKLPGLKKMGIKRLFRISSKSIAVSEVLQRDIQRSINVQPDVIGNFVSSSWLDTPITPPPFTTYEFLHVSTLDSIKNPMGILNAALISRQAGFENFRLTIVAEQKNCEVLTFIEVMKMQDYVRVIGPLNQEEIKNVFQSSHCFVLNSNYETFSIVALEALAVGLHLITTDVGFVHAISSEAIDKIEFNQAEMLSSCMMKAISKQLFPGEVARMISKPFSKETILEQYSQLYSQLTHA